MTENNPQTYKNDNVEFTYLSFETISSFEIGIEASKVRYLQNEYGRHENKNKMSNLSEA